MEASPSAAAPAVAATADHDEGEKQSTESAAATINATAADGSKTDGPDGDEPEEPAAWRWRQAQGRQFKGLTEEDGEAEWRGPFLFAVLADTQLGAMDDNEGWEDEVALCQEAVRRLNKLKPRFAIVCGDLVHHTPELYPDTDPGIRKRQVLLAVELGMQGALCLPTTIFKQHTHQTKELRNKPQVLDFKRAFAGLHESIPLLYVRPLSARVRKLGPALIPLSPYPKTAASAATTTSGTLQRKRRSTASRTSSATTSTPFGAATCGDWW